MKLFASLSKRSVDPDLSGRLIHLFRLTPYALLLTFLFLFSLLLCSPAAVYAQWGPEIRLTWDPALSWTNFNNTWSVASSGELVHVVWSDGRDDVNSDEIYYKRSTDGGISWSLDTRLSGGLGSRSRHPSVAVSGPYVHVIWIDWRSGGLQIYYNYSTNYGASWEGERELPTGFYWSYTPSMAVSGSDVHVVWDELISDYEHDIYYIRSRNNGSTWGDLHNLSENYPEHKPLFPSVAVSGEYVHVAWADNRPQPGSGYYRVYYRRSSDWGSNWPEVEFPLTEVQLGACSLSLAASGPFVHVFYEKLSNNVLKIHYNRNTNYGDPDYWSEFQLSEGTVSSKYPNATCSGSDVHLVWLDSRDGNKEIYYKHSGDDGLSWDLGDTRLSNDIQVSEYPSVSASNGVVHAVWEDRRDGWEIYHRRNPAGTGFFGFKTDSTNGRHFVRDPSRGHLHMVMTGLDGYIYYARSTDDGATWPYLTKALNSGMPIVGKYPTIGLAMLPEDVYPPKLAVCIAFVDSLNANRLLYLYNDGYDDPGMGGWHISEIPNNQNSGPPSLVTIGTTVYVAYRQGLPPDLKCAIFQYNTPGSNVTEAIDPDDTANEPSLAVDGGGIDVYAAWKRGDQIRYARRNGGAWNDTSRVDQTNLASKQPFVECYGDSVFVVWSDSMLSQSAFDVRRRSKVLSDTTWRTYSNVSYSLNLASESPTQAWREFTTWAESISTKKPDIKYWSPAWGMGNVLSNNTTWSYWPHSQMWYTTDTTHLMSAWTESPTANQPPYTVLTKHSVFQIPPGGDAGAYYAASAGGSVPSPYLKKRDGVMRFADKAVDYARDSLVYELPYLDPQYDYYLRVSSYRETGSNWAQALSVNGLTARSVQFAANRVDTAWIKIPPKAYQRDRKVVFSLKNVRGDYVTSLGLTLYQRDPRRGNGGGQSAGLVNLPPREVFEVSPNPTRGEVQVEYSLRTPGKVDLSVYDVVGRLVKRVVNGSLPAGVYRAAWDGRDQAGRLSGSGVYFLKLNTSERVKTKRLVVVR